MQMNLFLGPVGSTGYSVNYVCYATNCLFCEQLPNHTLFLQNVVYCGVTLAGVFAGFIAVAVYSNEYSNLASVNEGTVVQFLTTAATKGVILAVSGPSVVAPMSVWIVCLLVLLCMW